MARKKKAAAAEQQVEAPGTMEEVVQQAKDKLGAEVIEEKAGPAETGQAEGRVVSLPDPHELDSIELGPEKGAPRMRLFRSHRYQQIQIRFDEKPSDEVRELLHNEGWRWRGQETGWTKQLDKEARWRTQADAERLFKEIANGIRAQQGMGTIMEQGR
jgi:hypothetical protein